MENINETQKTNKWKVWGIISIILFLLIVGFFAFNYFSGKIYSNAYVTGANDATLKLIENIMQTGNIPIFSNETGNLTIKSIAIQTICGGQS